jgi:orsellinic acid C2-O-methyltransferase
MPAQDPRRAMLRLITAYRMSACVHVAAELGLADLLAEGARTSAELAGQTGAHEPSLRRLLRALVAMEALEEAGGRFQLTAVGEELRSERLRGAARFFAGRNEWEPWGALQHSVMTGERAFDHVYGMRNWDYYVRHPDAGARFDAAMNSMTSGQAERIVAAYDFSRLGTVVDVGGGDGTLLAEILRANPGLQGVLYDREDVIARAAGRLERMGLSDRCRLVGGDFLQSVPGGADAYVMKSILHDWDDAGVKQIVGRCREAGGPAAPLLVLERVLPATVSPEALEALTSDLNMMVANGGMERTEAEFRELLGAGGYRLQRVVPTGTVQSVLEAVPAT